MTDGDLGERMKAWWNMKRSFKYVLFKIVTAVVSSLLVGVYVLIGESIHYLGTGYQPLMGSIWVFVLITQVYAIPAYVLGGVPCSMLIDGVMCRIRLHLYLSRYLMNFILYALFGIFLIVLIRYAFQSGTVVVVKPTPVADALRLVLDGGLPALLFYHTSLLLRWVNRQRIQH